MIRNDISNTNKTAPHQLLIAKKTLEDMKAPLAPDFPHGQCLSRRCHFEPPGGLLPLRAADVFELLDRRLRVRLFNKILLIRLHRCLRIRLELGLFVSTLLRCDGRPGRGGNPGGVCSSTISESVVSRGTVKRS